MPHAGPAFEVRVCGMADLFYFEAVSQAVPHWASYAGCGFAGWRDFGVFGLVVGHAAC